MAVNDYTLKAKEDRVLLDAKEIRYKPQSRNPRVDSEDAEYDACYFVIKPDNDVVNDKNVTELKVKIKTKSDKMSAYIYETTSRIEMGAAGLAGNG